MQLFVLLSLCPVLGFDADQPCIIASEILYAHSDLLDAKDSEWVSRVASVGPNLWSSV